jgi:hypothetical protein
MKRIIRFLIESIFTVLIALVLLISGIGCLLVSPIVIILMFLDITFSAISDWVYWDIPFKYSIKETYRRWMR